MNDDVKLYFLVATILALIVASGRKPIIALLFFIALIYIRPEDDRPNLADLHLPLIFLIILTAFYFSRSLLDQQWLPKSNLAGLFLAFCLSAALSAGLGVDADVSYDHLVTFSVGAATFFIMLRLISNENDVKLVLWLLVVCGLAFVYYAIYLGSDCIVTQDGTGCGRRNFVKLNHSFGQPNYLGLNLVIIFNLAYGLLLTYRRRLAWMAIAAAMVSFIWVTLLTNSRGAFIAFSASLIFHWLTSHHKMRGILVLVCLLIGLYSAAPDSVIERVETLTAIESDQSAMGRIDLWEVGFGLIRQYPLLGIGIGNFEKFATNTPHNAYIQIAVEMGVPALLLWLWLMARAFLGLLRVRRERKTQDDPFLGIAATATAGSLVAILVQGGTTGLAHREFVYVILAIAGVIVMLHQQTRQPVPEPQSANLPVSIPYADSRKAMGQR